MQPHFSRGSGVLLLLIGINALGATHFPPLLQGLRIRLALQALAAPLSRLLRQHPTHLVRSIHTTNLPLGIAIHETAYRNQSRADSPRRLPRLLVVPADAQTDLSIDFESARWGEEPERRGSERVLWRQDDPTVVHATCIRRRRRRSGNREVPVEKIRVGNRMREEMRGGGRGGCGKFSGFLHQPPRRGRHCCDG